MPIVATVVSFTDTASSVGGRAVERDFVGAGALAVVGAAGGAAAAASGYDAYVSEWLGGLVEADRKTKADYIEDARQSRRAFLERQARERAEARWRQEWKEAQQVSGYGDSSGTTEVGLVPERVMAPPAITSAPAADPPADAARPVIFDDCTIDVVTWNPDYPGMRT